MRNKKAKEFKKLCFNISKGESNIYKNAKRIYNTQGLSVVDSLYVATVRYCHLNK